MPVRTPAVPVIAQSGGGSFLPVGAIILERVGEHDLPCRVAHIALGHDDAHPLKRGAIQGAAVSCWMTSSGRNPWPTSQLTIFLPTVKCQSLA